MELDIYVCQADPRLFLLLPAGQELERAVPHHARIFLGSMGKVGSGWTLPEAANYLDAEPEKLADHLQAEGYYIYRLSKHDQPPTDNS
jgi:hypothetical protein